MQFYPAGETIARRLLDLPQEKTEWIVTAADTNELVAAGFQRHEADQTCFIHPDSGDIYQLARHQYIDEESGLLRYQCDHGVTLENELATRALTILAMASDGDDIVDPFDGRDDMVEGKLRHVTPYFVYVPENLLITAVWAARLKLWGFGITHATFKLMKKMVASGAVEQLPRETISDAIMQAMASPRPSELFRVLHHCGALATISRELDQMFDESDSQRAHAENVLPDVLQSLDQAAAETENVSTVIRRFHRALGDDADSVFDAFGMKALFEDQK